MGSHRSRHRHTFKPIRQQSVFGMLWESFWHPPLEQCPKCGGDVVEYYDPFFFSPLRTLRGKRRVRCIGCHFIWRPKKKGNSAWDRLMPKH